MFGCLVLIRRESLHPRPPRSQSLVSFRRSLLKSRCTSLHQIKTKRVNNKTGELMPAREITSVEELGSLVGQEVAVGGWFEVTQDRINLFAEATGDHQWIHVDVERAKAESPYGTTIAHGFLTLSLLSHLMSQTVSLKLPVKMGINYGLNKVRFPAAVPAGSKIRVRAALQSIEEIPGGRQLIWNVTVEREGGDKPCCVAEWLVRYYV
jgi:acyl dehydratase